MSLDTVIRFRADKDTAQALIRAAKREQRSPGAVARRLLREGLGLQPKARKR